MGKENYEQYLTRGLESELKRLACACVDLGQDLDAMTKRIGRDTIDTSVDPTGLVKNQGLKIDLLCIKIHMLQRELAVYKSER